jgi:hypothetical protein
MKVHICLSNVGHGIGAYDSVAVFDESVFKKKKKKKKAEAFILQRAWQRIIWRGWGTTQGRR